MDDVERLKTAIKYLKQWKKIRTQAEIASDLGYNRAQTISDYLNEKVAITPRFINAFTAHYGINRDWWETGRGSVFNESDSKQETTSNVVKDSAGTPYDREDVLPDPSMPGIYQSIVMELIESSKAQRKISEALLEERQLIRETAKAAINLVSTATITASLDEIQRKLDLKQEADQVIHLFLAGHIAALEGKPAKDLLQELDNKMMAAPSGQKKRKTAATHS